MNQLAGLPGALADLDLREHLDQTTGIGAGERADFSCELYPQVRSAPSRKIRQILVARLQAGAACRCRPRSHAHEHQICAAAPRAS